MEPCATFNHVINIAVELLRRVPTVSYIKWIIAHTHCARGFSSFGKGPSIVTPLVFFLDRVILCAFTISNVYKVQHLLNLLTPRMGIPGVAPYTDGKVYYRLSHDTTSDPLNYLGITLIAFSSL